MEAVIQLMLICGAVLIAQAVTLFLFSVFLLLSTACLAAVSYTIWVERTGGLPEMSEAFNSIWKAKAQKQLEETGFFRVRRDPRTGDTKVVPYDLDEDAAVDEEMEWERSSEWNGRDLDIERV